MKNLNAKELTSITGGQSTANRATDWENVLLRDATLHRATNWEDVLLRDTTLG